MKQVLIWFSGGFFRKLGSIFAWLILGLLVAAILTKFDINLFGLVHAEEISYTSGYLNVNQCQITTQRVPNSQLYSWNFNNCVWDSNNAIGNSITFGSNNGHLRKIEFNVVDSGDYLPGNYIIQINSGIDPKNNKLRDKYTIKLYTSYNNGSDKLSNTARCEYANASGNYQFNTICEWGANETFDHIKIVYEYKCDGSSIDNYCEDVADVSQIINNTNAMSMNSVVHLLYDSNPTNAINNQTDIINDNFNETNNNLENIYDSLTDTDTSSDSDSALYYFNHFDYQDNQTITQILLSPISFLQGLMNGSTNDLCITLKSNNHICLPNGKIIWNRNSNTCSDFDRNIGFGCASSSFLNLFKNFFNLVVGGYLSYKMLMSCVKSVHNALDPTLNIVEVMKL